VLPTPKQIQNLTSLAINACHSERSEESQNEMQNFVQHDNGVGVEHDRNGGVPVPLTEYQRSRWLNTKHATG